MRAASDRTMRRGRRSHRWLGAVAIAGVIATASCAPIAFNRPIKGQLLDADTRRPIPGAVVTFHRAFECFQVVHTGWSDVPVVETRTDERGQFRIATGLDVADCWSTGSEHRVKVLAPGYVPIGFDDTATGVWMPQEPIFLERWRYASESAFYRRDSVRTIPDLLADRAGPAWLAALKAIRGAAVRPLAGMGVFAADDTPAFDQIVTATMGPNRPGQEPSPLAILARDARTGTIRGFDRQGRPIPDLRLPSALPSAAFVGGGPMYPILASRDRFFWVNAIDASQPQFGVTSEQSWSSRPAQMGRISAIASRWNIFTLEDSGGAFGLYELERRERGRRSEFDVTPRARLMIGELLPGPEPPVECMAHGTDPDSVVVITRGGVDRRVFLVQWGLAAGTWQSHRVEVPQEALGSPVTACAVGSTSGVAITLVYLAFEGPRLAKFALERYPRPVLRPSKNWSEPTSSLASPDGARPRFVALTTHGDYEYAEIVYGVASTGWIYRFSANGEPDRRVALTGPGILTDD